MTNSLTIDPRSVEMLLDHVGLYGIQGVETGAFLLTAPGDPMVTVLALAGETGIIRRYGLLVLSAEALAPLFDYAENNELQIRAQIHSHAHEAFMSPTDKAGNIRMSGFIAGVVPDFGHPPGDPSEWGWWTFSHEDWFETSPAQISDSSTPAAVIIFDSRGIREHH